MVLTTIMSFLLKIQAAKLLFIHDHHTMLNFLILCAAKKLGVTEFVNIKDYQKPVQEVG